MEVWRDLKRFFEKKWFLPGLVTVMVLSYVTLLHNPTMGIDDTSFDVYYVQGVSPAMGRWCLYLINKFLPLAYNPYIVETVGLLCFCVSISLWCVTFYRILGERVSYPVYLAFACVMISNPIISEVVIWYLQDGIYLGYGAAALAVIAAGSAFYTGNASSARKRSWALVRAVVFLTIAMGCYESFIIVWVMGMLMFFLLGRMIGRADYCFKPGVWMAKCALCMVGAVGLRTLVVQAFIGVFHLQEEATVLRSRGLHEVLGWFDGSKSLDDFLYVMKEFFVKYYVNAIVYLPVLLLVLAIGVLGLTAVWQTVKRKDGWILAAAAGMVLVPWIMPVLEGVATYYRSSQYIPLLTAFAVLLIGWMVTEYRRKHPDKQQKSLVLQRIAIVLLGVVLYHQVYEMNKWLYVDAVKYEDTKATLREVALEIGRTCDTSKPVCVIGEYEVPRGFVEEAYCPDWSKKYMLTEWIVGMVDESIFDAYCDEYGYAFAETPRLSFITWGTTAFFQFDRELVKFWNAHGHDFAEDGNLAHYEAAREMMKERPAWPSEGSIVEMEDHIIVNFGD